MRLLVIALAVSQIGLVIPAQAGGAPRIDDDGTIHVPAFTLPGSVLLSDEARAELKRERADAVHGDFARACSSTKQDSSRWSAMRDCVAKAFYRTNQYKHLRARYPVTLSTQLLAGVYVEVFAPMDGIAPSNLRRVLIDLHSGGFEAGSRWTSQLESVPIASVAKIKVISIDYRQAPENKFPAATEDVESVYRELLKTYQPGNIGIYGCSAGGALTAQATARFSYKSLPLPGAVGMFCEGAPKSLRHKYDKWIESDSGRIVAAMSGFGIEQKVKAYYEGIDRSGPLASPGDYDEVMKKFPPSLLISGTRDFLLSSVLATHAQLVRLGVEAELHAWEGMEHGFLWYPELPEAREAYMVIAKFFDRHLAQ
jgi:epsilon-lactone hydrolase